MENIEHFYMHVEAPCADLAPESLEMRQKISSMTKSAILPRTLVSSELKYRLNK